MKHLVIFFLMSSVSTLSFPQDDSRINSDRAAPNFVLENIDGDYRVLWKMMKLSWRNWLLVYWKI